MRRWCEIMKEKIINVCNEHINEQNKIINKLDEAYNKLNRIYLLAKAVEKNKKEIKEISKIIASQHIRIVLLEKKSKENHKVK